MVLYFILQLEEQMLDKTIRLPIVIKNYHILQFLFLFFFFMPSSSTIGGKSLWYLLFLACTFGSLIFGYRARLSRSILVGTIVFMFALLSVSISLIRSVEYLIADDVFELIRTTALLMFLIVGFLLSTFKVENFLSKFFKFYIIVQLIVCIVQKFGPIKTVLSMIWDMKKAWILRSTGTANNPNTLVLMSLMAYVYIFVYAERKSTKIGFSILTGLVVLLSGSRTGLLGYMFTVVCLNLINKKISFSFVLKSISVITILALGFYGIIAYIAESNAYMGELLRVVEGGTIDLSKVHTFNKRMKSWAEHYEYFNNSGVISYFIGIGPAKGIGFRVMDNDYSAVFIKYGGLGVMAYSTILIFILSVGILCRKLTPQRTQFLTINLLVFSLFAITGAAFLSLFNFMPVLIITGMYLKLLVLESESHDEYPLHNVTIS